MLGLPTQWQPFRTLVSLHVEGFSFHYATMQQLKDLSLHVRSSYSQWYPFLPFGLPTCRGPFLPLGHPTHGGNFLPLGHPTRRGLSFHQVTIQQTEGLSLHVRSSYSQWYPFLPFGLPTCRGPFLPLGHHTTNRGPFLACQVFLQPVGAFPYIWSPYTLKLEGLSFQWVTLHVEGLSFHWVSLHVESLAFLSVSLHMEGHSFHQVSEHVEDLSFHQVSLHVEDLSFHQVSLAFPSNRFSYTWRVFRFPYTQKGSFLTVFI